MDYLDYLEQQESNEYSARVQQLMEEGYDEEAARQEAHNSMTNYSDDNKAAESEEDSFTDAINQMTAQETGLEK